MQATLTQMQRDHLGEAALWEAAQLFATLPEFAPVADEDRVWWNSEVARLLSDVGLSPQAGETWRANPTNY